MQLEVHMVTMEDLMPQGHFLRQLEAALDLSFVYEETELQRLWSDVPTQNIASYKTLEKASFQREGLIRGGEDGEYLLRLLLVRYDKDGLYRNHR